MHFSGDTFGYWGKKIIEDANAHVSAKLRAAKIDPGREVGDPILSLFPRQKIGILGAGIAGLYTGMILKSLNIDFEILEASDRVGGRIKTYHFNPIDSVPDYYDEGAMYFPLPKKEENGYINGFNKRLAELIAHERVDLEKQLIPYLNRDVGPSPAFSYYNGVHKSSRPDGKHEDRTGFKAGEMGVGQSYIGAGASAIQNDVYQPFVQAIINDLKTGTNEGWLALREFSAYSTRGYMASKYLPSASVKIPPRHLPSEVINWINLIRTSSGGYEQSLSESVFAQLATAKGTMFEKVEWRCFRGGSEVLTNKMQCYLDSEEKKVKLQKRVTAIDQVFTYYLIPGNYHGNAIPADRVLTPLPDSQNAKYYRIDINDHKPTHWRLVRYPRLKVTVAGEKEPRLYDHVISTLPLTVLRILDLRNAGLHVLQHNALRALSYASSTKVAVRFKSPWWTEKLGIRGGSSYTDLPIRQIVYPSYFKTATSEEPSAVLIAANVRTTDASRLSALASTTEKRLLLDLVLRNLAEAHESVNGVEQPEDGKSWYDFLNDQLASKNVEECLHVVDWNADVYSMGGYASFSPGQFEGLYAALTVPAANGALHFAGEAVSTRHGWAVGALDSGWKAVGEYLELTSDTENLKKFWKKWGKNSEWTTKSEASPGELHLSVDEDHLRVFRCAMHHDII